MKNVIKIVALILYYGIAKNLPNLSFPGGRLYNYLRYFCLKKIIKIGHNCRIMRNVYIGNGNNIEIGDCCRLNEGIRLDNVKIGNHVMIARESILLGKMHEFKEIEIPMEQQGNKNSYPIIIEDDVWVGVRVLVMPGVKISKGTIVGAGAVLTKDTEVFSIYGGVPAKMIRYRNK